MSYYSLIIKKKKDVDRIWASNFPSANSACIVSGWLCSCHHKRVLFIPSRWHFMNQKTPFIPLVPSSSFKFVWNFEFSQIFVQAPSLEKQRPKKANDASVLFFVLVLGFAVVNECWRENSMVTKRTKSNHCAKKDVIETFYKRSFYGFWFRILSVYIVFMRDHQEKLRQVEKCIWAIGNVKELVSNEPSIHISHIFNSDIQETKAICRSIGVCSTRTGFQGV